LPSARGVQARVSVCALKTSDCCKRPLAVNGRFPSASAGVGHSEDSTRTHLYGTRTQRVEMPGQEVTDPLQHFMHDVRAGTSQSCLRDSSVSVQEEEYDQDYSTEGSHECDGSEGSISAHASNNNSYHGDPKDLVPSEGSRASSPLSHEEAEGNAKEANYENMRRVALTLTQGDCEKLLEYQAQQRREKRRTLRREALEILILEERCSARRSARRKERDEA